MSTDPSDFVHPIDGNDTPTSEPKYIPSTTLVMETFAVAGIRNRGSWKNEDYTEFSAAKDSFMIWLNDHDAKIAAQAKVEALREAANDCAPDYETTDTRSVAKWLRARAATIEGKSE